MISSKQNVLQLYPTAHAVKNTSGYSLGGVHDVFKVDAPTEEKLWEEVESFVKRNPSVHMRYSVMSNHLRWIEQRRQETMQCT